MDLSAEGIDDGVRTALERMSVALGADRGVVYLTDADDPEQFERAWEWCAEGVERRIGETGLARASAFPHYQAELRERGFLKIDDLAALPRGATAEREAADLLGARSLLVAPMSHHDRFLGVAAFFTIAAVRAWTDAEVLAAQLFAHILIGGLLSARNERRMAESEAMFRALTEASFGGVALSSEGVLIEANQAFADLMGYDRDELPGKTPEALSTPLSAQVIRDHIHGALRDRYVVMGVRKDGGTFPLEIVGRTVTYRGRPARVSGFRDLRGELRARQLEEQMRRTQRLESLGVLAGGVAHDFNNLLVGILGNLELAMEEVPEGSDARGRLERATVAARRASELTSRLLTYAGQGRTDEVAIDLGPLVEETVELALAGLEPAPQLSVFVTPDLPPVSGDPPQLAQVVLNLVTNAAEALDGEGEVRVRVEPVEADASLLGSAYLQSELSPGPYVALVVEDDGSGMDPGTVARVFEPFYTTKFTGRGLGLAAVLGIVQGHGGTILVRSAPGEGTRFTVLLPPLEGAPAPRVEVSEPAPRLEGSGRALVLDDDPEVREVLCALLENLGYETVRAASAAEALALASEPAPLAVAVVDLTMPDQSGIEVLAALRDLRPDLAVVLASGHDEGRAADALSAYDRVTFLPKPFDRARLAVAIRGASEG